jgi:TRAP-type uncharacterized transport system substrate-binding protein
MRWSAYVIGAGCCLLLTLQTAVAQTVISGRGPPSKKPGLASELWQFPNRDQVNEGTVTVITGPVGGITPLMAADLARVLDDEEKLRVLPVNGKGSVQNVIDLLFLKTIDMGFVYSDTPEFFRLQYGASNIESRLRYIAKLYDNEVYIVAPTSIKSIYDLAGKKIMAPLGVGFSARIIFSRLNIDATFDYRTDDTLALQKVIDGQADAWIVSVGKIFPIARNIQNGNGRLHLVPIPYNTSLWDIYLPSKLTSDEYPNLIPHGETVETLATSAILASFNWPENSERYAKVAKFTEAFFSKSTEFLKPPRNPKWRDMNIAATVLGWTRFKAAQDWLDRNAHEPATGTRDEFMQFIRERGYNDNLSEDERLKLFSAFSEWLRDKKQTPANADAGSRRQ